MTNDKLEPCPFCGAPDDQLFVESVTGGYQVHCENCLAQAPFDKWQVRALRSSDAGWQPIDTAPKDGVRFIAAKFVGHPDHSGCFWWASTCSWSEKWNKWWDGIEPSGLAGPTHWMHVENPPHPTNQGAER